MGTSLFAWIREERLFKAKFLLSNTQLSVQQICFNIGYEDPANFTTSFKACFSVTPTKFRKQVTQSKKIMTDSKA